MRNALRERDWDILIVDYVMPVFSAPAAMEVYRELDLDMPFIIVSGQVGEETAIDMMKAGAHDYISKLNRARLIPAIARELKESENRRSLKLAARQRAEAAQQNHLILDTMAEGIFGIDREGRYTFINRAAEQLLGYSAEELLGQSSRDICQCKCENGRGCYNSGCLIYDVLDSREPIEGEERFCPREGEAIPVEFTAASILDNDDISGAVITFRDISERKRAAEALLHTNRTLATLSQCNHVLVRTRDERELVQGVCNVLQQTGGYVLAWFGFAGERQGSIGSIISSGDAPFIAQLRQTGHLDDSPAGLVQYSDQHQLFGNLARESIDQPWCRETLDQGHIGYIALPVTTDGQVFGSLNVYSDSADSFFPREIALLEELAGDLAYGLQTLRTRHERNRIQAELDQALLQTAQAIAATVEKRDPYTAGHQQRVGDLAAEIALKMGLDDFRIQGIRLGAGIHDIGKIYIPAEILSKPGSISSQEFALVQTHSEVGYDIIKDVAFPWPVAEMILQHHERLDGSGYPNGLKGDEITLEARILSIADVVEAITSHRPYRPALGIAVAIDEIEKGSGTKYDPEVVDCCMDVIREQKLSWLQ